METVFKAIAVYFFLMIVLRIAGKRTLRENSTFDLVLLLIISETVQQAMLRDDNSLTTALILIVTLVFADIVLSLFKQKFSLIRRLVEPAPVVLVENGLMYRDRMEKVRVGKADILAAGRELRGVENWSGVKHAVLEQDGHITVIPREEVSR